MRGSVRMRRGPITRSTVEAVELVRNLLADERIDADTKGSAEIELAPRPRPQNACVTNANGCPPHSVRNVEFLPAAACRERLFASPEAFGAKVHRPAFALHPLRYCRGLAAAAVRRGVRLHAGSRVLRWQTGEGARRLVTAGGELRAKRVIYACNGFMEEGLNTAFDGRWLPIISAIIVTRPLSADELGRQGWVTPDMLSTSRQVLNYFRLLPDDRLLFGGRGTSIGAPAREAEAYAELAATLGRLFPALAGVDVEYRWHGLVCFTSRLYPTLGHLPDDDSVYFGYGYHGNGVSEASWCGKQLADWIGGGRAPGGVPAALRGLAAPFPLARFRRQYFQALLAFAKWRDARSTRAALRN